mmetsp:Transcript_26619/g.48781  ORF Transcript_26619/g.48781 Transcript_26619/m.48781 type:complete len:95 (-) Transcript_26619:510-794(-)
MAVRRTSALTLAISALIALSAWQLAFVSARRAGTCSTFRGVSQARLAAGMPGKEPVPPPLDAKLTLLMAANETATVKDLASQGPLVMLALRRPG